MHLQEDLATKGIGFKILNNDIDTTTSTGKLPFQIMGAIAEFERDLIRERTQAELKPPAAVAAKVVTSSKLHQPNSNEFRRRSRMRASPPNKLYHCWYLQKLVLQESDVLVLSLS